jgi:hypothetical protein
MVTRLYDPWSMMNQLRRDIERAFPAVDEGGPSGNPSVRSQGLRNSAADRMRRTFLTKHTCAAMFRFLIKAG